jgi:hypothetical protein
MTAVAFAENVLALVRDELDARAIEHQFVVWGHHSELRVGKVNGRECEFTASFGPGGTGSARIELHVGTFWRCPRGWWNSRGWTSGSIVVANASPAEIADRILQQLCDWGCINLDVVLK